MTNSELSNEFDIIYNNITSNQAPGLDPYEKSVFLTKAQDELIKAYFSSKSNKMQEGIDSSEIRQVNFSNLIANTVITGFDESKFDFRSNTKSVGIAFSDSLAVLNEYAIVQRVSEDSPVMLTVVNIGYDEYDALMVAPYKRPLKNQAWRINTGKDEADIIIGIGDILTKYVYRYVMRPTPIVLEKLPDNLTICGKSDKTEVMLDESLHHELVQRAAELAKAAYLGDLSTQLALGNNSQTGIGILTQSK